MSCKKTNIKTGVSDASRMYGVQLAVFRLLTGYDSGSSVTGNSNNDRQGYYLHYYVTITGTRSNFAISLFYFAFPMAHIMQFYCFGAHRLFLDSGRNYIILIGVAFSNNFKLNYKCVSNIIILYSYTYNEKHCI